MLIFIDWANLHNREWYFCHEVIEFHEQNHHKHFCNFRKKIKWVSDLHALLSTWHKKERHAFLTQNYQLNHDKISLEYIVPSLINLTFDKLIRLIQMCDQYQNIVLFKVVNVIGTNRIHIFVFNAFTLLLKGVVANYITGRKKMSTVIFLCFIQFSFSYKIATYKIRKISCQTFLKTLMKMNNFSFFVQV